MIKKISIVFLVILLTSCATFVVQDLVARFGKQDPARFDQPQNRMGGISYQHQVRPILEKRCVVCHSCYDAPCQLNLASYDGITRGASKTSVYESRLFVAPTTRLFIDANKPSGWREKGFFPVLNEFSDRNTAEQQASLLARSLNLKSRHPLNPNQPAPDSLDFSLNRANACPSIFEYQGYELRNPLMGMPFGFPEISQEDKNTILRWLQQGAPYDEPAPISIQASQQIKKWEDFFNDSSNRSRLVSRYIYEHLFLAHLYFANESSPQYFRLVRSTTPPGQPIQEIASRRPIDAPGVNPFYYRLRLITESIVAKSHMPYSLSEKRMSRWKELFFSTQYRVDSLPEYDPELAANPFKVFEQLPVKSRYQFMLDEAEFSLMGFIKGPVCRGQTALNVINDHFWVFFRNPEFTDNIYGDYLSSSSDLLTLPAEHGSTAGVSSLIQYTRMEKEFLQAKSSYLEQRLAKPGAVNLDLIWSGNGNPNAGLTIYRHFDSATVLKGLVGEKPKTAWVINYSLLERIHYLLTAGYDVFGNVGHQLNTRIYMDYLRKEGEFNFITLLPQSSRLSVRDFWYRDTAEEERDLVYGKYARFNRETDIKFTGAGKPEHELMSMLTKHLGKSLNRKYDLKNSPTDPQLLSQLKALMEIRGAALKWMPEASFLSIEQSDHSISYFTLFRNTSHLNVTRLLTEHKTLVPEENGLDVIPSLVGAYPNAFYRINRDDLMNFASQMANLKNESDYENFAARFSIRRTHPDFWKMSDLFSDAYRHSDALGPGIFDLNRFENR